MKKMKLLVEFVYIDILKHKIKIYKEGKKVYFKLPEDNEYCRRNINSAPNKRYVKFIEKLAG